MADENVTVEIEAVIKGFDQALKFFSESGQQIQHTSEAARKAFDNVKNAAKGASALASAYQKGSRSAIEDFKALATTIKALPIDAVAEKHRSAFTQIQKGIADTEARMAKMGTVMQNTVAIDTVAKTVEKLRNIDLTPAAVGPTPENLEALGAATENTKRQSIELGRILGANRNVWRGQAKGAGALAAEMRALEQVFKDEEKALNKAARSAGANTQQLSELSEVAANVHQRISTVATNLEKLASGQKVDNRVWGMAFTNAAKGADQLLDKLTAIRAALGAMEANKPALNLQEFVKNYGKDVKLPDAERSPLRAKMSDYVYRVDHSDFEPIFAKKSVPIPVTPQLAPTPAAAAKAIALPQIPNPFAGLVAEAQAAAAESLSVFEVAFRKMMSAADSMSRQIGQSLRFNVDSVLRDALNAPLPKGELFDGLLEQSVKAKKKVDNLFDVRFETGFFAEFTDTVGEATNGIIDKLGKTKAEMIRTPHEIREEWNKGGRTMFAGWLRDVAVAGDQMTAELGRWHKKFGQAKPVDAGIFGDFQGYANRIKGAMLPTFNAIESEGTAAFASMMGSLDQLEAKAAEASSRLNQLLALRPNGEVFAAMGYNLAGTERKVRTLLTAVKGLSYGETELQAATRAAATGLLGQNKITKEKWQTTEEFVASLREVIKDEELLAKGLNETHTEFKVGKDELEAYIAKTRGVTREQLGLHDAFEKSHTLSGKVSAMFDGFWAAFMGDTGKAASKLRQFNKTLEDTHKRASNLASTLNIIKGLAIYRGFGAITQAARDVGRSFLDLTHYLGLSNTIMRTTDAAMARHQRSVIQLSKVYGRAPEEVGQGFYQLLQNVPDAAHDTETAFKVLDVAMKTSVAGAVEVGDAIDTLTSVMLAFNIPMEKAEETADKLFMTVQRGRIEFSQMKDALGNVITTASRLGFTLDETLAATAGLTRIGLSPSKATTALNNLMNKLVASSGKAERAFEELGISVDAATVKNLGLFGVMERIIKSAGITEEMMKKVEDGTLTWEQAVGNATGTNVALANTLRDLFPDIRTLRAAIGLVGSGFSDADKDMKAIINSTGSLAAAFRIMQRTLSERVKKLGNDFKIGVYAVLVGVLPVIVSLGEVIMGILQPALLGLGAAIKTVMLPFELVFKAISWLVNEIPILSPIIKALAFTVGFAAGAFGLWALQVGIVNSALVRHTRALLGTMSAAKIYQAVMTDIQNPLGKTAMVLDLVRSRFQLGQKRVDGLTGRLKNARGAMGGFAATLFTSIITPLGSMGRAIDKGVLGVENKLYGGIKYAIIELPRKLAQGASRAGTLIMDGITEGFDKGFTWFRALPNTIGPAMNKLGAAIKQRWLIISYDVLDRIHFMKLGFKDMVANAKKWAIGAGDAIKQFGVYMKAKLVEDVLGLGRALRVTAADWWIESKAIWANTRAKLANAAANVAMFAKANFTPQGMKANAVASWQMATDATKKGATKVKDAAKNAGNAALSFGNTLLYGITHPWSAMKKLGGKMGGFFKNLIPKGGGGGGMFANLAKSFGSLGRVLGPIAKGIRLVMAVLAMANPIVLAVAATVGVLAAAWIRDWGGIRDRTKGFLQEISSGFQTWIVNPIKNVTGYMAGPVVSTWGAIEAQISAGFGWLFDQIGAAWTGIKNTVASGVEAVAMFLLKLWNVVEIVVGAFKKGDWKALGLALGKGLVIGLIEGIKFIVTAIGWLSEVVLKGLGWLFNMAVDLVAKGSALVVKAILWPLLHIYKFLSANVLNPILNLWNQFAGFVLDKVFMLGRNVVAGVLWLGEKFLGVFKWALEAVWNLLPGWAQNFLSGLWEGGKHIIGGAIDIVKQLGGKFLEGFNWILGKAKEFFGKLAEWFGAAWDKVKEFFGGASEKAGEVAGSANEIGNSFVDGSKQIGSAILGAMNQAYNAVDGFSDRIYQELSPQSRALLDAYDSFARGVTNALTNVQLPELSTDQINGILAGVDDAIGGMAGRLKDMIDLEGMGDSAKEMALRITRYITGLQDSMGLTMEQLAEELQIDITSEDELRKLIGQLTSGNKDEAAEAIDKVAKAVEGLDDTVNAKRLDQNITLAPYIEIVIDKDLDEASIRERVLPAVQRALLAEARRLGIASYGGGA